MTGNDEISNSGQRTARDQEALKGASKHDDPSRVKGIGDERQRTSRPKETAYFPNQKSVTEQAYQEKKGQSPWFSHKKASCVKDNNCYNWHPPFFVFPE